jgi:molybdate transport system substrate-binding protein
MLKSVTRLFYGLALATGLSGASVLAQNEVPVVAAAANLQFAIEEIAEQFTEDTGSQVRLSIGSTGNIARQIRQGAPFELFLSADDTTIAGLDDEGLTRDEGMIYAVGRIVIMAPTGSPLRVDGNLDGLASALEAGEISRFAIANPEHAPFGVAARKALQHKGLWEALQTHLVLGENISQAAQFALSGNAEGGIIAYSLALAAEVGGNGTFELIPEDWHEPLRQRMALLKDAGPVAEAFYDYLQGPPAREIMERYGFLLPKGE